MGAYGLPKRPLGWLPVDLFALQARAWSRQLLRARLFRLRTVAAKLFLLFASSVSQRNEGAFARCRRAEKEVRMF